MDIDAIVFDADEKSFASKVLDASRQTPVAVDFWAEWCGPCRSLAPILEKVVREYGGGVKLAKVNTDNNRALASAQGIRSLPTVRLFKDGAAVDEFSGAYPASYLRDFLSPHVSRASDTEREQAETLRTAGRIDDAVALLREAATADPQNYRLVLDLADALLALESLDEAAQVLKTLPSAEKLTPAAKRLFTLLDFARMASGSPSAKELTTAIELDSGNLDARLQRSAQFVLAGDIEPAMNDLLAILRIDKSYRDSAAHKALLSLFELLGDHPLAARYRSMLAATLY